MNDPYSFSRATDAMSPEIERGARVLFHRGAVPREGDVAVIDTPAGRLVRRVYFNPMSVTLEAPIDEPRAFRAESVRFAGTVCMGPVCVLSDGDEEEEGGDDE